MHNSYDVNLVNPQDFVHLLKKYSVEKIVFRTPETNSYDTRGKFIQYEAPVMIGEVRYDVKFLCAGPIPAGWQFDKKTGNIEHEDGSKAKFVKTLLLAGVAPADLERLKKVKATELKELLDDSPPDDEDITDIAIRLTKGGDKHIFQSSNPDFKEVLVKVSKCNTYSSTMEYVCEIPWVHHINSESAKVGKLLNEAGFGVFDVRN